MSGRATAPQALVELSGDNGDATGTVTSASANGVRILGSDCAEATLRANLSDAERGEMFTLLDAHFDGVTPSVFGNDLDEKDWVLRIRRGARLVGFSTLQVYETTFEGSRLNIVYSGDTIMASEAWGSPVLAQGWIAVVRHIQRERMDEPWFWLLLSSGFRTYRFLPVFWREFWPRHDATMPSAEARLMAHLARARFGSCFHEVESVVRFVKPQSLRRSLVDVPSGKRRDPHVEFFLERNPGHAQGDELVCLTDLSDSNLSAAGRRMLRGPTR